MNVQLPEGGWSYRLGAKQCATEPTALALLALPSDVDQCRQAAVRFLIRTQNRNGSWPAFPGDHGEGSGFTGLALYALTRAGVAGQVAIRALGWLLDARGLESHWLWRWKFRTTDRHVRFDPDKFGWPWMPGTVSWVVPTSYSLLALRNLAAKSASNLISFRIRRGVEMLYDRICPQGGWNAGNGVVYGVPLVPHPDATALALLALRGEPSTDLSIESLDWLMRWTQSASAPWSLCWVVLATDAYGRGTDAVTQRLAGIVEAQPPDDCATLAVVSLALACGRGSSVFGEQR